MAELRQEIQIINKLGLHARAAAKLVSTASGYSSHVDIEKNGHRVNGKSIMGVMMLAAGLGSQLVLHVNGHDADHCMGALTSLINDKFGEEQ
ncbi:MAG: phosphocarrier protein HPr [Pseudomonadota bacterium]|nr:phosphocarrier protein HPr [Pseudomonadota bacterium]